MEKRLAHHLKLMEEGLNPLEYATEREYIPFISQEVPESYHLESS